MGRLAPHSSAQAVGKIPQHTEPLLTFRPECGAAGLGEEGQGAQFPTGTWRGPSSAHLLPALMAGIWTPQKTMSRVWMGVETWLSEPSLQHDSHEQMTPLHMALHLSFQSVPHNLQGRYERYLLTERETEARAMPEPHHEGRRTQPRLARRHSGAFQHRQSKHQIMTATSRDSRA